MKKILITANTDRHILVCHLPYLKWFKENGYCVHLATNTSENIPYVDKKINLNIKRKPFHFSNLYAIFKLKKIIKKEKYDLIYTHTPTASVITRLACKFANENSNLIYMCHGFHFFKKAPRYYWILYYPIEKYLMKYVKKLFVMNNEDYFFSTKHFKNVEIKKINGIGFDEFRLKKEILDKDIDKLYVEFGLKKDDFIISYIAELSKRKNQISMIKYLSKTDIRNTNIKILLIGDDNLNGKIERCIKKYNLSSNIITTGFRKDINVFLKISDLILSVSKQEGLPLNVMEAIFMKKYVIATSCRGNVDLITDKVNGFIIDNLSELWEKIIDVKENYNEYKKKYEQYIDIDQYKVDKVLPQVIKNI